MGGGAGGGLKLGAFALLVVLAVFVFFLRDVADLFGASERQLRAIGIVVVTGGILIPASAARREAQKGSRDKDDSSRSE